MGFFEILKSRNRKPSEEIRSAAEVEKDLQWQRAKQQIEEERGRTVRDASIPSSVIPNQVSSDHDPYDRKKYVAFEKLGSGLPVDDSDIESAPTKSVDTSLNPNVMGNARITGNALEESPSASETSGILDPQMDAYLQTMMAEEAAAALAKDQDRKPIVEN